jgi:hypothetical protein
MALLFNVIGTSFQARYSTSSGAGQINRGPSAIDPVPNTTDVGSGVINSKIIAMSDASNIRAVSWAGLNNWSANVGFTVIIRIVPRWTGTPAATQGLTIIAGPESSSNNVGPGFSAAITTAGKISIITQNNTYSNLVNSTGTAISSAVSGTAEEWAFSWTGATGASFFIYKNGVLFDTLTSSAAILARNNLICFGLGIGVSSSGATSQFDLNEYAVYDTALTGPDLLTLYGRTDWISSTSFDGSVYTNPGTANVRSASTYTFAGVTNTGTCIVPSASDVRLGTPVDATTGTCAVPSASNVRLNIAVDNTVGNVTLPLAATVLQGVTYDSNLSVSGTLNIAASVWDVDLSTHNTAGSAADVLKQANSNARVAKNILIAES